MMTSALRRPQATRVRLFCGRIGCAPFQVAVQLLTDFQHHVSHSRQSQMFEHSEPRIGGAFCGDGKSVRLDIHCRELSMNLPVDSAPLDDPSTMPLDQIDVADPRLFRDDIWEPYFSRLRRDDP